MSGVRKNLYHRCRPFLVRGCSRHSQRIGIHWKCLAAWDTAQMLPDFPRALFLPHDLHCAPLLSGYKITASNHCWAMRTSLMDSPLLPDSAAPAFSMQTPFYLSPESLLFLLTGVSKMFFRKKFTASFSLWGSQTQLQEEYLLSFPTGGKPIPTR